MTGQTTERHNPRLETFTGNILRSPKLRGGLAAIIFGGALTGCGIDLKPRMVFTNPDGTINHGVQMVEDPKTGEDQYVYAEGRYPAYTNILLARNENPKDDIENTETVKTITDGLTAVLQVPKENVNKSGEIEITAHSVMSTIVTSAVAAITTESKGGPLTSQIFTVPPRENLTLALINNNRDRSKPTLLVNPPQTLLAEQRLTSIKNTDVENLGLPVYDRRSDAPIPVGATLYLVGVSTKDTAVVAGSSIDSSVIDFEYNYRPVVYTGYYQTTDGKWHLMVTGGYGKDTKPIPASFAGGGVVVVDADGGVKLVAIIDAITIDSVREHTFNYEQRQWRETIDTIDDIQIALASPIQTK